MKGFDVWMLTLVLALWTGPAVAGELLLGTGGRSTHRIVVPDAFPDERIETSVRRAADLLQRAFRKNGIDLAILAESEATGDQPAIHVGQTGFARSQGIDFDGMEGWTYTFKVVGRNLIIAGNDRPDPIPLERRRPREARRGGMPVVGTLKGVTEFLYRHAGVRFLMPGEHGVEFLPTPVLYVPADLDVTHRTYARDIEISRTDDLYTIANGFEPMPTVLSNYGHYHFTVISPKTHGETHPEYFVYHSGRRDNRADHLCFSNPEVRELIYQKILEDCDAGYDIIEVGQNDGFRPCSCEDCFNLYDIHPTTRPADGAPYLSDPAWGEKLWIMHHAMAERLLTDRPGKTLMLCAYGPTRNPPRTLERFPENVIIEIMRPTPEIFAAWDRIEVPGGYAVYTYTWGTFVPKNTIRHINTLTETILDNGVHAIQNNLRPLDYGLEGMNVYAYRRMLNAPGEKTMSELFDEYIDAAFREAAGPMRRFFLRLHQRLDFRPEAAEYARVNRDPLLEFSTLYTPPIMAELENQLARAESIEVSEAVRVRLAKTRFEFDYLKHIAGVTTLFYSYQHAPDPQSWDRVLSAVEARNDWLSKHDRGRRPSWTWYSTAQLMQPRVEPFNWDTARMREAGFEAETEDAKSLAVRRADGNVTLHAPVWETLQAHALQPQRGATEPLQAETTFSMLYDDANLYVRVEADLTADLMETYHARGRDEELWLQECMNILLAPEADKSQYYYLTYEPVDNSFIDAAHGFITDPLHPKFGWNDQTWDGEWTYENDLQAEQDRWVSLAVVPFETLNVPAPRSGTVWAANVGRVHYREPITDSSHSARMAIREISVWSGRLNASYNPGEAYMGDVIFE